ncbi:MAG: hypothetical protein R2880_20885 [Deinococcales bacterium]
MKAPPLIIGIDPGKHIGLAWLRLSPTLTLLKREVVSLKVLDYYPFPKDALLVLGDSTQSHAIQQKLAARAHPFKLIDEHNSSLEAKELYFREHPQALLSRIWAEPPLWDDYAAYVIAKRYVNYPP